MKRTYNNTLSDINDAPNLQSLVCDKRATTAKGNRRNRRYENRMLTAQAGENFDEGEDTFAEDN